jgi:hypothetical protein
LYGSHNEQKIKDKITDLVGSLFKINNHIRLEGAVVVEIGTGWDLVCSILLYLLGAETIYTYDHVRHVRFGLAEKLILCIDSQLSKISEITSIPSNTLEKRFLNIKNSENLDDLLARTNIHYQAPGDASKTGLTDGSVDLVLSYAVLEHVSREVIYDITLESKRILKRSGIAYHVIGLFDHYVKFGKKLTKVNFLKYPESLWSFFVKNKISYHNRLREKQFIELFNECGARIVLKESNTDPADIEYLKSMKIDKSFQGMTYEELAIYFTRMIISFEKDS